MRLRVALIVLTLVVAPAVVFAVAQTTTAPTTTAGWTAYPSPSAKVSPGTAYATGGTEDRATERAAIKADPAKWELGHPGGTCQITPPDSAQCTTADGLPTYLGVGVIAIVSPPAAP